MVPYIIIFLLCIYFTLNIGNERINKTYFKFFSIILFVAIILHDGLRWNMGTDWWPYCNGFTNIVQFGDIGNDHFEGIYVLLNWMISRISSSYTFFLIFIAFIIYALIFKWLKLFVPQTSFFIAFLMLYVCMIGMLGSNRANLAFACSVYSLVFYFNKKYLIFIALTILAISFHISSILFFIFVLLCSQNWSFNTYIKFFFVTGVIVLFLKKLNIGEQIFIYATDLIRVSEDTTDHYIESIGNSENGNFLFYLMNRFMIIAALLWRRKNIDWRNRYLKFSLYMYLVGVIIGIFSYGYLSFLSGRLNFYYLYFSCILWAYFYNSFNRLYEKQLILIFFVIYGAFTFSRSIAIYPELFIPYKSIF